MSKFLTFNDASEHTTGQKVAFVAPVDMTLVEVADFRTNVAGTTGATTFDVEINGTSALASAISVASGATVPASLPAFTSTAVEAGDIITLDCDGVASTEGFGFNLVITYIESTATPVAVAHDHRFGQPASDYATYHDAN
jgi:hypothetical protein